MIRYPAFDPPEYINWQADPQVVEPYQIEMYRQAAIRAGSGLA